MSSEIFAEYSEVLSRPELHIRVGTRNKFLQFLRNCAHLIRPSRQPNVTADPDDNIFIECADEARADYLITDNLRHFPHFWKKTKIVTSREFLDLAAPHLFS
jgi:putative PIN family toxin of toxin-antitoxin system